MSGIKIILDVHWEEPLFSVASLFVQRRIKLREAKPRIVLYSAS